MATFGGRRPARRNTHSRGNWPCLSTARVPWINNVRRYLSPHLDIVNMRILPLALVCRGTSPSQATNSRPDLNAAGPPIAATTAVALSIPTPGTSATRRLATLLRCRSLSRRVRCEKTIVSKSKTPQASGFRGFTAPEPKANQGERKKGVARWLLPS